MAEGFNSLIDDLAVDQSAEPEVGAASQPTMGLVVGAPMTEKEFVAAYDGQQRPSVPIIFENERGEVETRALGRGADE
jgi:hypothetical protein